MPALDEKQKQEHQPGRRMLPGPALPGHAILQDEERHAWIIDQSLIVCTPPEFACLKRLLEQANRGVSFEQLVHVLPPTSKGSLDEHVLRMRVRHVMSSLRNKLWHVGIDIVSLRGTGYLLLAANAEAHHDE